MRNRTFLNPSGGALTNVHSCSLTLLSCITPPLPSLFSLGLGSEGRSPSRGAAALPSYRSAALEVLEVSAADKNTVQSLWKASVGELAQNTRVMEQGQTFCGQQLFSIRKNSSWYHWDLVEIDWSWYMNWLCKWLQGQGSAAIHHMMENGVFRIGPEQVQKVWVSYLNRWSRFPYTSLYCINTSSSTRSHSFIEDRLTSINRRGKDSGLVHRWVNNNTLVQKQNKIKQIKLKR